MQEMLHFSVSRIHSTNRIEYALFCAVAIVKFDIFSSIKEPYKEEM